MATVEKLEKSRVKLSIEVAAQEFDDALNSAYHKTKARYNVPGFRKGKAPRKVIESMYGEGTFYEEAFEIVHFDAYQAALKENNIEAVGYPDLSIENIGKGTPLTFTAEVDIFPEFVLGEYKGIEVVKTEYTVEDAEINALMEKERDKLSRFIDVDRPVENGDHVVIDYVGSVDGVEFDGGAAEDFTLVIGSNTFIPGFEDQLIGMAKGEQKDITVTFPQDYHSKELAGKDAMFKVDLHEIKVKQMPDLDDEFAQDVSEFDTLEDLLKDKRNSLQADKDKNAQAKMRQDAIAKLVDATEIVIPESMIERQTEAIVRDMQYKLAMSGLSLEQYLMYTSSDINKFKADQRESSIAKIKSDLILDAIAKAEDISITDQEIDEEILAYCDEAGIDVEKFKQANKGEERDYIRDRLCFQRAIDIIMDNCTYVQKPEEEKPKTKKTAKPKPKSEKAESPAKPKTPKKTAAKATKEKTKKSDKDNESASGQEKE